MMNTTKNTPKEYICKICIKYYSSRQNLWRHNHTFHNSEILLNAPIVLKCTPEILSNAPKVTPIAEKMNELQCEYCKIIFTRKYNLY